MPAARRVASALADSLRKRERQIMAAAYDLANKSGAFSISFVAKRTSVKALIYFNAPKGADAHLEAEEPEDEVDEAEAEEGGRAVARSAEEQHRTRREANPATAQPTLTTRTSGHPNGNNVQCAQQRGSSSSAAKGRVPKARVDRNALSARTDGAPGKRTISPTATSTDSTVRASVRQCKEVDAMESENDLGDPATQDGADLPLRPPGFPPGMLRGAGAAVPDHTDHG